MQVVEPCADYCPAGEEIVNNQTLCQICPKDTYKEATDYYGSCINCPITKPRTSGTGGKSMEDCRFGK